MNNWFIQKEKSIVSTPNITHKNKIFSTSFIDIISVIETLIEWKMNLELMLKLRNFPLERLINKKDLFNENTWQKYLESSVVIKLKCNFIWQKTVLKIWIQQTIAFSFSRN